MRQNRKAVDQNAAEQFAAISTRIVARREVLARAGSVVATWRTYRGRRLGPYYRLSYREDGRQRSIYLGRSSQLAEHVRGLLTDCQRPARQAHELRRTRAVLMKDLRRQKAAWDQELQAAGLYARGYVVRGWRHWRGAPSPRHLVTPSPLILRICVRARTLRLNQRARDIYRTKSASSRFQSPNASSNWSIRFCGPSSRSGFFCESICR